MASFFEKVLWTECTGDAKPNCPKHLNKEHLPAYKARCSECGSKAREVTKLDPLKAGLVAAVVLLILGGAGWYVRSRLISSVVPDASSVADRTSGGGGPVTSSSAPRMEWDVETEIDGTQSRLSPDRDFDLVGNVYQYRKSVTQGDRIRINVNPVDGRVFAFYTGNSGSKLLISGGRGTENIPSADDWFKFDDQPGMEEFVLICGDKALPGLSNLGNHPDSTTLNQQLRKLQSDPQISIVRVRFNHR